MKVGIVSSRFQILHLKHIEYILAAKMRCERLYIGIEEPDNIYIEQLHEEQLSEEQLYGERIHKEELSVKPKWNLENPLTYIERHEMLSQALLEFGMEKTEFDILPFPIHHAEYVLQYVPQKATYFLGVSTSADRQKRRTLKKLNIKTEVLWERDSSTRGITEKEVLDMVINDEKWEKQLPKSTVKYMKQRKLIQKIKDLAVES